MFSLRPRGSATLYVKDGRAIPLAEDQALTGLKWYNNDGSIAFPRLLLASGTAKRPGAASAGTVVKEALQGVSSGWSELALAQPCSSTTGGVYAMFQLPPSSECHGEGAGTGAGIGYIKEGGLAGWLSADGVSWIRLRADYGLAVEPIRGRF